MATTQITVAAFQTKLAELADAVGSGDFATANVRLAQADAILAGLNIAMKMQDDGSMIERIASLEKLRETLREIRQNSVQDPSEDIAVTSADFSGGRD